MSRRSTSVNFGAFLDSLHANRSPSDVDSPAVNRPDLRLRILTTLAKTGPLASPELARQVEAAGEEVTEALARAQADGLVETSSPGGSEVFGLTKFAEQIMGRVSA